MTIGSIRACSVALFVLAVAACDDVSPVDFQPKDQDADVPDADPEQVAACRSCLSGDQGACRPAFDVCAAAHPLCEPMGSCFTDTNCWRQLDLDNIADLPPCALGCYEQVGLTSLNDIASAATPVFICLMTEPSCASACFGVGAADAGPDAAADPR
jgi:hypothetical protein